MKTILWVHEGNHSMEVEMYTKNLSDIAHLYGQLLSLYQTVNFTTKKINEIELQRINWYISKLLTK